MINYEIYARIKHYHEQKGLTAAQIVKELDLNARTVAKRLSGNQYHPRKSALKVSKLDSFKDSIVRMMETYPYTAIQILQCIRDDGYAGGYSILKEYISKVKPRRAPAFLKLSFAPGACAQVDWGSYGSINIGSTSRRLSFFVMVIFYSRMMYLEFTVSQTMEHFMACHQNAFAAFGGVPKKIMVDNLKSAVLKRALGQQPVLNPTYVDFANHYGFKIAPCGVRKANEKGRVENAVGYVKKNFLAGLELPDYQALNNEAKQWLDTIANVRLYGETKRKPIDCWAEKSHTCFRCP